MDKSAQLPKIGFVYLDHVMRFFDRSNFKGWPDKIDSVTYHWGNDKQRFINEVKRKGIDILIGNIPATAYETFREISRALPNVQFVPSLDAQFANKSKENVTHFCKKYQLPIPKTDVFYELDDALNFLAQCRYPKIIKKSYGPSNYGGYFVHKVDSFAEAKLLIAEKKYYPVYVQEFVPMVADIRVMLIGHKPVCAFWRRPPEGEWLTNTSQGGAIDYNNVPRAALDIARKASKAANAEYWACDIALGNDGKFRILECATAFAAFPYIRDWIGQYLMWLFSNGQFAKPYIPLNNWEELGKIDSKLLRTMRQIAFSKPSYSQDCGDSLVEQDSAMYQLLPMELRAYEEWPSEIWNFQDNYVSKAVAKLCQQVCASEELGLEDSAADLTRQSKAFINLSQQELTDFFYAIKGVGKALTGLIIKELGLKGTLDALNQNPHQLLKVKGLKEKKLLTITEAWQAFVSQQVNDAMTDKLL